MHQLNQRLSYSRVTPLTQLLNQLHRFRLTIYLTIEMRAKVVHDLGIKPYC